MATWNLFVLYNRKAKAYSGDLIYTCPLIGYWLELIKMCVGFSLSYS